MRVSDFQIGIEFKFTGARYRCTDVGSRVVVGIRIDRVEVGGDVGPKRRLNYVQATEGGWFKGPPYPVAERVFDENDLPLCSFWP